MHSSPKTPLKRAEQFSGHHVVDTKTSFIVLVALGGLMVATIAASYWDTGSVTYNNIIAMFIASVKAFLVMTFFMGLKWASGLTRLWAIAGFVTFILMFIILIDYNFRSHEIAPGWDAHQPETAMPRIIDPTAANKGPMFPQENAFRPRN